VGYQKGPYTVTVLTSAGAVTITSVRFAIAAVCHQPRYPPYEGLPQWQRGALYQGPVRHGGPVDEPRRAPARTPQARLYNPLSCCRCAGYFARNSAAASVMAASLLAARSTVFMGRLEKVPKPQSGLRKIRSGGR
jgi:hypothetical protein